MDRDAVAQLIFQGQTLKQVPDGLPCRCPVHFSEVLPTLLTLFDCAMTLPIVTRSL